MALVSIPLVINDVGPLFMCPLMNLMPSLENCPLKIPAHFLIRLAFCIELIEFSVFLIKNSSLGI